MRLPSGHQVFKDTPIYAGSNFTWGEATKGCRRKLEDLIIDGKLQITARQIEEKIIATAIELDIYRSRLGNRPIWVNSWYRPQKANFRVGGSKYSRHQYGDAVDIRSDYFEPYQIYNLLDRLHVQGGLAKYAKFVHVDFRGKLARWFG